MVQTANSIITGLHPYYFRELADTNQAANSIITGLHSSITELEELVTYSITDLMLPKSKMRAHLAFWLSEARCGVYFSEINAGSSP